MDIQSKSVLISILISLIIATPILQFTIDVTRPTQEQIDLCSTPSVVCDSYLPFIFLMELFGILMLYFVLQNHFENYLTLQKNKRLADK